jgi:GTP pyrophosphokinase
LTKDYTSYTIDDLIKKVKVYIPSETSLNIIRKAYRYAEEKHKGQLRESGEDYIYHPLSTAMILTTVSADCDTICAGLLHDVIEDCDVTKQEIEDEFNADIAKLVDGVSKISKMHFSTENEALVEYYKKIIVGMSEDVRVIIIKLADRLHNMRTLWALPKEKQKQKAKEVLEILAPIAHHLGIHKIKSELEDLSLRYLKPDVFYDIAEKLNTTKLERDNSVAEMINEVSDLLKEHNIKFDIKGRSKSIYSIYKKMEKGKKFSELYDLLALRILVDTEQECYTSLGLIHSKFKPMPKRFKDYIAMPKVNGYQSLHTTIFGTDGQIFEIQIRTHKMDEIAENGVAAHWAYKEKKNLNEKSQNSTEAKLQFFKSIMELDVEKMSSEDFVNSVKDEVLGDSIYVYTPKGDVFELPKGSTGVDFAYKVHTKIGETMVGVVVNDTMVPLSTPLKDGDIVKINTKKDATPSMEWLDYAKTSGARNKIKAYFSKVDKEISLAKGKDLFLKEIRRKKLVIEEVEERIPNILKELKVADENEMYIGIGTGKYSPISCVALAFKEDKITKEQLLEKVIKNKDNVIDLKNDVLVDGIDEIKVTLARCCNPILGDDIVGYISRGNGIIIHTKDCHNLEKLDERLVDVKWNKNIVKKFITVIEITASKKENLLLDIITITSSNNIGILNANTISTQTNNIYELTIEVTDSEKLKKYMNDLKFNSEIIKVERVFK